MTWTDQSIEALFSSDVPTARAKFLEAARRANAPVETHVHPRTGPAGEVLATDVCRLGPRGAKEVIFLLSGTHGTEGFVGAGLQNACLADPALLGWPRDDLAIVFCHLINPYGTAWGRYVNEDNADLNKNLNYGERLSPTDPLFAAFDDMLSIHTLGAPDGWERLAQRRARFLETHDEASLLKVLKAGQSERPKSIVFNGQGATWSKRILDQIVTTHLAGATRVLYVDLHSGMGGFGDAYIVAEGSETSIDRVFRWMGGDAHHSDLVMDVEAKSFVKDLHPGIDVTAVTVEGGTETWGDEMRTAMLTEMYHHMYGDPLSPAAQTNSARFKRFYYPDRLDWKVRFFGNGTAALGALRRGFEGLGAA